MILHKPTDSLFADIRGAVADLHRRTQPNGIALDPDAQDILVQLAAYEYYSYVEPVVSSSQKKGEVIVSDLTATHSVLDKSQEEIQAEVVVFNSMQESYRKSAYQSECDPIAFDMLRNKATREQWDAKTSEIKARYPYAEDINQDGIITESDSPTVWQKFKTWLGF